MKTQEEHIPANIFKQATLKRLTPLWKRNDCVSSWETQISFSFFFPREIGSSRSLSHKYSSWVVLQEHGDSSSRSVSSSPPPTYPFRGHPYKMSPAFSKLLTPPYPMSPLFKICASLFFLDFECGDVISGRPLTPFWLYIKVIHRKYYKHLKKVLTKAIWADKKWAGFWQISLYIK